MKKEITKPDMEDFQMGAQLSNQYQLAISGMREVLKFGAMMLMLREYLSTREQGTGNGIKGDGIEGWLKQYAPKIKRATAYRFMHVAEAVQAEFKLPAALEKQGIGFSQLALYDEAKPDEKILSRQMELWEFVDGTSQRSWLDRFKPKKEKGGYRERRVIDLSPEELAYQEAQVYWHGTREGLFRTRIHEPAIQRLLSLPQRANDPTQETGLLDLIEELEYVRDLAKEALDAVREGDSKN